VDQALDRQPGGTAQRGDKAIRKDTSDALLQRVARSRRHSDVVDRSWMTVTLAALLVAGAACSGAGRDKPKAEEPHSRPSAQSRVHRPGPAISDVAAVGPRLAFAAGTIGLDKSADGGRSWALTAPGSYYQVDVVSKRVVFAVGRGQIVRSVDGGQSWHALPRMPATVGGTVDFWSVSSGVALDPSRQDGIYWITRDGGQSWRRLRLPGWSLGHGGVPIQNGDPVASSVCFEPGGDGWAVAARAGRWSVLESPDGDHRWHVALPSQVLPKHAGVAVAGCTGDAVWVFVSQSDRYGEPAALDLLHTNDLGRSWHDVLRWGFHGFPSPAVPSPPGWPRILPNALGTYIDWIAAPQAKAAWIALTDDKGGQTGFGSTGNGGLTWHFWSFPGNPNSRQVAGPANTLPPLILETLTAVDARHAWMLFGRQPHPGRCWLYVTDDGGAGWSKVAVFRTRLAPPQA